VVTLRDYDREMVEAARSVLLELMRVLGAYRRHIAVIGGWVPKLLLPEGAELHGLPHAGSMDIDLAINHKTASKAEYESIKHLLTDAGYYQKQAERRPSRYYRDVDIGGRSLSIGVDLLAGELEGTARGHRHQRVQDVLARKLRCGDLAFVDPRTVALEGRLPGGARCSAQIPVASLGACLVLKGLAIADRLKEKDYYDVHFCVRNAEGGAEALAQEMRPLLADARVREGLAALREAFRTVDSLGPVSIAKWFLEEDAEARALLQRDAHERVSRLLDLLGA